MTASIVLFGIACLTGGCETNESTPAPDRRVDGAFERDPGTRSIVPAADRARLVAAVRAVLEPYGIAVDREDEGLFESRDFYRVLDGLPLFGYVEVTVRHRVPRLPELEVAVSAHAFERVGVDGTPASEGASFRYVGPDRGLEQKLLEGILTHYALPSRR